MGKLTLIPVQPIGEHQSGAFVDGRRPSGESWGEFRLVTVKDYPAENVDAGKAFRRARQNEHLSLREAAKALGIGVVELCDLEFGRATLSAADWGRALDALTWRGVVPASPGEEGRDG